MPMKKYLLFVWIAVVFCSCNEDNFDISPMEQMLLVLTLLMMNTLCQLVKPLKWVPCF